jgi:hypothetical protein
LETYAGCNFRLTDIAAEVAKKIMRGHFGGGNQQTACLG